MNKLLFLGTGSGGDVMITQSIATSSLYFELNGLKFILDPGPGTLVNAKKNKIRLMDIDGVLISHPHPDHCADANALITAFQHNKSGFLIASRLCLEPSPHFWPVVSKFHLQIPKNVVPMAPGDKTKIKSVEFEATAAHHYHCGMGFKISSKDVSVGYTGNGKYFDGQENQYEGCKIIIFDTLSPFGLGDSMEHMTIEGAISFLKSLKKKPELAIIQHFTESMLKAGIEKQAEIMERQTNIRTVAAKDGMEINLEKAAALK